MYNDSRIGINISELNKIRSVVDVTKLISFSLVFELMSYIVWNLFSFCAPNYGSSLIAWNLRE